MGQHYRETGEGKGRRSCTLPALGWTDASLVKKVISSEGGGGIPNQLHEPMETFSAGLLISHSLSSAWTLCPPSLGPQHLGSGHMPHP